MNTKQHKGNITDWRRVECDGGLGFRIDGVFCGHPEFDGERGMTSFVIAYEFPKHHKIEIETNNSRYTLIGNERG